ncbi:class I SAM-dependent methyltransferase [Elioraea rosea]|uniref:class I SAM-dependent methyltransferase n=1 Tax=Elioraea rosea TaxID=2492390 RepID=UPI00118208DC|nr:SAM-dependent methyltransferase [Elioraea rosea]
MTAAAIRAEIAATGPMRLDRFMAHANAAYYASRDPLGARGDFVTAPEITQAFGELLGVWAVTVWQAMGTPTRLVLAELGPGRGTLMEDALRAIGRVAPGFRAALSLHLVETSPALREIQRVRLGEATWHETAEALPEGPMILIANEFLDALPIRRFFRAGEAWVEQAVTLAEGRLAFTAMPAAPPPDIAAAGGGEVCEAARALAALLGTRLAREGGAALFIDYGRADEATQDSLQAVRGHARADPLAEPGEADLTAHVDFRAFAAPARAAGAAVQGPVPQGEFLRRLGLPERTAILCRNALPAQAALLQSGARRLMDADAMGLLFKAIALCDPRLPPLPGFAA